MKTTASRSSRSVRREGLASDVASAVTIGSRSMARSEGQCGFRARSSASETPRDDRAVQVAVSLAKRGDREAMRFLYLRYSDNVYGYVRSIVRDDHEAEDVTQHVFAKLMTVLVKYDQQGVPFLGWLLRLAHNAAIDQVRGRRAIPTEEIFLTDPDAVGDEARNELHEALSVLPEEQRSVVLMRHLLGLSPSEIAERMGRSESSIHGLHHRGRRALQAELLRLEAGPQVARAVSA